MSHLQRKVLPVCFLFIGLWACDNEALRGDKKEKGTFLKTFYIELVDKANNSLSKKVLAGIMTELTKKDYIKNTLGDVMQVERYEKVDTLVLYADYKKVHTYLNIQKITGSNMPGSDAVKVQLVMTPKTDKEHAVININLFCRQGKPEWWQCAGYGPFKFPDDSEGLKVQTHEELVEAISRKILDLTFEFQQQKQAEKNAESAN